jgi:hypothetical protein
MPDEPEWHEGRTVNISRSGLLFTCDQVLEVGTELELFILFPQGDGSAPKPLHVCRGHVVRRVLMQWPDLSTSVAIQFASAQVQTGEVGMLQRMA